MSDTFLFLTKKCHALGNFNALMAIVAGLNNFSVQRLRKPWEVFHHVLSFLFSFVASPSSWFADVGG